MWQNTRRQQSAFEPAQTDTKHVFHIENAIYRERKSVCMHFENSAVLCMCYGLHDSVQKWDKSVNIRS